MNSNSSCVLTVAQLSKFRGKFFVFKISGETIAGPHFEKILEGIVNLLFLGIRLIVVCGARPQINEKLKPAGLEAPVIEGIRIVPPSALRSIREVYSEIGQRTTNIVSNFDSKPRLVFWPDAIMAKPPDEGPNRTGKTGGVKTKVFESGIFDYFRSPKLFFVSSLAKGTDNKLYYVDADEVAAAIAIAMRAEKIFFLSASGVRGRDGKALSRLTADEVASLIENKFVTDGMIPKTLSAAFSVLQGVGTSCIIPSLPDEFLPNVLFGQGSGTAIVKE